MNAEMLKLQFHLTRESFTTSLPFGQLRKSAKASAERDPKGSKPSPPCGWMLHLPHVSGGLYKTAFGRFCRFWGAPNGRLW